MSRTRFVIKHMNFPIYWTSKLQTEIELSTAEVECIALAHSSREVIPILILIKEINDVLDMKNPSKTVKNCINKCNRILL